MKALQTHSTHMELSEPAPPELPIGSDLALQVRLSCASGCDLGALPVTVTSPDGRVTTIEPTGDRDSESEDDALRVITLKAPQQVGAQVWTIRFPPHESDGVLHAECTLPVCVRTLPHATSLAVWAVPSPVVMGERFRIKVGAKSAAGCGLGGTKILISDESGAVIAQASLQDTPWPGTSALYWAEVEVPAPDREGMFWCAANFAAADTETPHERSSSKFSVAIVRPPEHRLTVEVFERDTGAPIEDAQVRLGAYRAATDPSGRAEVAMPKGTYDLTVWKVGYEAPVQTVDVREDVSVQIEAVIVPPENPDAAWLM
jgi:Carboxypeptidase regulatory-like domain